MPTNKEAVESAIRACGPGATHHQVAEKCGLSDSTVRRWRKELEEEGVKLPPPFKKNGEGRVVEVEGLTAEDSFPNGLKVIEDRIKVQDEVLAKVQRRYNQTIKINDDKPIAVAMLSDLHLGGPYVDYRSLKADAQMIAETDGFYAIGGGDYFDNWIGKLEWVQRGQAVTFSDEVGMVEWWFDTLREKLLCVVGGNHDFRTKKTAGIDLIARILRNVRCLWDGDEIKFKLKLGKGEWKVKLRHIWKYKSVMNESHGIERDLERGDGDFDIGIAAHEHRGTIFRECTFHGAKRLAVILGTYKRHDRYAIQWGFPP
jgi:transposase-like protein